MPFFFGANIFFSCLEFSFEFNGAFPVFSSCVDVKHLPLFEPISCGEISPLYSGKYCVRIFSHATSCANYSSNRKLKPARRVWRSLLPTRKEFRLQERGTQTFQNSVSPELQIRSVSLGLSVCRLQTESISHHVNLNAKEMNMNT
ncbi:hypothetical protein VTN02DRAFT_1186 [Thermoascus thermophilus]